MNSLSTTVLCGACRCNTYATLETISLSLLIVPHCSMSPKFLKLLKMGHENASLGTHANPLLASICAWSWSWSIWKKHPELANEVPRDRRILSSAKPCTDRHLGVASSASGISIAWSSKNIQWRGAASICARFQLPASTIGWNSSNSNYALYFYEKRIKSVIQR